MLTYQSWVALTLVAVSGQARESEILDRLTSALKIDQQAARLVMGDLTTAAQLKAADGYLHLTHTGRTLYDRVRTAVDETLTDLYSGIPAGDLEVAGRVLTQITARANTKLEELAQESIKIAQPRSD